MSEPQGSAPPNEPQRSESAAPQSQGRELIIVHDTEYPIFDTGHFEHMWRLARRMSMMTVVPESFRGCIKRENNVETFIKYEPEQVIANVMMVVNQARIWKFDPYQLLSCASIIHGKVCYEGKVLHAAVEQCVGIRLKYTFQDGVGQEKGVTVSGQFENEDEPRTIFGRVKDWHKGTKSPWAEPGNWERQLRYRGAREWCRAYSPGVLFGVYSIDEIDEMPTRIIDAEFVEPPPPPPPREAQHYDSVEEAQQTESVFENEPPPPPRKPVPVKGEKQEPKQARRR